MLHYSTVLLVVGSGSDFQNVLINFPIISQIIHTCHQQTTPIPTLPFQMEKLIHQGVSLTWVYIPIKFQDPNRVLG